MNIYIEKDKIGWGNRLIIKDDNEVTVDFCYDQSCCEIFGYYVTDKQPVDMIDIAEPEINISCDNYNFRTIFFDELTEVGEEDNIERNAVVFKLINSDDKELFIVLYNVVYCPHSKPHDYVFSDKDKVIREGII